MEADGSIVEVTEQGTRHYQGIASNRCDPSSSPSLSAIPSPARFAFDSPTAGFSVGLWPTRGFRIARNSAGVMQEG